MFLFSDHFTILKYHPLSQGTFLLLKFTAANSHKVTVAFISCGCHGIYFSCLFTFNLPVAHN